jgi:hypothetical protein
MKKGQAHGAIPMRLTGQPGLKSAWGLRHRHAGISKNSAKRQLMNWRLASAFT